MENNYVLVTGAHGQDGTLMCKKLVEKGFKVFGVVKKNSTPKMEIPNVEYLEYNLNDYDDVQTIIKKIEPSQVYNFLGFTNVTNPWSNPVEVYEKNFMIPIKIMESIKIHSPKTKFLQSSSSLIFGEGISEIQNEKTEKNPIYHYGFSKKFTDDIVSLYRNKFNLFFCSAIFFNHESEIRGDNFFSKKLIKGAVEVHLGERDFIELGNLESYRDYGYADDYIEACIKILEQEIPDDYIVSSGSKIKLYDFVKIVFHKLNLDISNNLKITSQDYKPDTLSHLFGDNDKIISIGWSPKTSLEEMIDKMINYEKSTYNRY
jgi:GDPmannose 4,6-dehydratase